MHAKTLILIFLILIHHSVLQTVPTSDLSLNARALSSDEALVTWSFIGDVDVSRFRLYIATSPVIKWRAFHPNRRHTEFRLQGLVPSSVYFIKLEAYLSDSNTILTAITHIKTPPYGPRPPIGVTVKKLADDKVKVTWSPSGQNGKIGYLVSYSEVDANDQPAGELRTEPVFGTSSSFVIDGLRSDLRYRFRVSALSRYGEGIPSSPVFLGEKRTEHAKIVIPPKHQKVTPGGTAVFVCKAIAVPTPTIIWRRSGKKLSSNVKDVSIVNNDGVSVLRISNVNIKQKGPYVCVAGNNVGRRAKAKGVLTVLKDTAPAGYPAMAAVKPASAGYVGSNITLQCSVKGKAPLNIVWYKNSYPISLVGDRRLSATMDGHLNIRNVQTSDAATYECSAENKFGLTLSAKQVLHIKDMPYIPHRPKGTTSEQTIEVPHGSTVRLRCIPVDQHAGTITWFKNNERVGNDVTNKQEYTVADVDDDFTITCVVGYKTYNATKTYHIVIKKEDDSGNPTTIPTPATTQEKSSKNIMMVKTTTPPSPSGPDHVTITGLETPKRLGEHTSLTCVTSPSDPAASITWFARGRKLTDAVTSVDKTPDGYVTTSRLEIHVTDKDENATYKCRADNKELGKTVWSSVILRIYGSGKKTIISIPPTITKAKRLNNTSAVVQWKPPTAMLRYIQRFKIYYTPASNNSKAAKAFTETLAKRTRKHKSSSLVPGVRYKVQVALVTSDGEGPRSVPSWIQSTEQHKLAAITSAPKPVSIKEHDTAVFTCTATGQPLSSLNWQHNDSAVNFNDLRFKMWRKGGTSVLRIDDVRVSDSGDFKCIATNVHHGLVIGKSASLKVYDSSETPAGFPEVTNYPEMVERPGRSYLTCDIVSDWPFNITWYKNSYPVSDSSRIFQEMGRLHFRNLTTEDDGNYECSVTNKFGTAFSKVTSVIVNSARRVNEPKPQVKEVRVAPGSNVNLTCVGVGTPAPRVKWQYRGQDLETGGSSVLQLIDIRQSRNYTCVAIGFGGRTFATFAIIVEKNTAAAKVKPAIITDATRVVVNYGEDANLTCATRDQSVLYFKWLHNGKLIFQDNIGENINVSVLHVPKVTESRNYTCVAVGDGVTTEANFKIIALNAEGPTITMPPKDQKVKEGKSVRFLCRASGVEPVSVTWQTDERTNLPDVQHLSMDVDGTNTHQLLIASVSPHNSGIVFCVATDADGKTTTSAAKLVVYSYTDVPRGYPKFSNHPVSKSGELGTSVDFTCDSDGDPAPTVTWYKDDFPVASAEDKRITMYKGRLIIDDLRSTDSGFYQCAAVNAFGTTYSKSSLLTVTDKLFPPEFTSASDPVTVERGASVNLTCTADGYPLPFVKWQINGVDIDKYNIPAGGNVLLIRNVQSSGNYTCMAYNSLGVISTDFEVKMRSPPKIVNLPNQRPHVKEIRVAPGSYVNLTCIGTGITNPVYTWKSNGVDLINQHDAILALKDVRETKNYTCLALGAKGISEATFEVIVEDAVGPLIVRPPVDKKVEEGSLVRFHCQVSGNPAPVIFWELNGRRVDERIHDRYKVSVRSGESVLDIEPAKRRRDAGVVTCVADNGKGQYSRNSAHLKVYDGTTVPNDFPVITEHPNMKVVASRHDAVFYCEAVGTDNALIQWYVDGFPIQPSDKYDFVEEDESSDLIIRSTDSYDEGSYQCSAENDVGIVYSLKSSLYVRERKIPPSFTRVTKNPDVSQGSNIELTCEAIGVPMPLVRWEGDGRTIKGNKPRFGSNTLYIENVQKSRPYTCIASNQFGKITTSVLVNVFGVEALPSSPQNVKIVNISTNDVILKWEESTSRSDHPVVSYIIQLKKCEPGATFGSEQEVIVDAMTRKYKIRDLTPSQCYQALVMAQSTLGRNLINEQSHVEFSTQRDEFHNPPQNVSVRPLTTSSIMVSWQLPTGILDYLMQYQILFTKNPNIPLFAWDKQTVQKNQTLATIGELKEQAVYYIIVQAVHVDEETRNSEMVEVTLATPGEKDPSLITNLYADIVSPSSVRMSWQNPDLGLPITGYSLYIDDSDENFEKLPLIGHMDSYIVEGLYPGAEYNIKIAPITSYGEGPTSASITIRLPIFVLEAPEVEQITAVNSTAVMLRWTKPSPENDPDNVNPIVGYVVYTERVTPDETGARNIQRIQIDGSQSHIVVNNLEPATEYRMWVASVTKQGDGPSSDPEVVITASEDSRTPRIESVTPKNNTAILVKWKPPSTRNAKNIRGYFVYVEKIRSGPWDPTVRYIMDVRPGNQRSVVMGNLLPGHEYRVEVAAYGQDGEGPRSNPEIVRTSGTAAVTPLPSTVPRRPQLDDVAVLNSTAITVVWQPPEEELPGVVITGYYIYVEKYQGGYWEAESRYYTTIPPTGQIFVINNMSPNTKYRVSVTALSTDGEGPPSQSKVVVMDREEEQEFDQGHNNSSSSSNNNNNNNINFSPTAIPEAPILDEVTPVNTSSLLLKWRPSPRDSRPENQATIRGYYLYVEKYKQGRWRPEFKFETNALNNRQQIVINGLEAGNKYNIRVAAFSSVGEGPKSAPMAAETFQSEVNIRNGDGNNSKKAGQEAFGFCQLYLGTVCSAFLKNKSVFMTSRFDQQEREKKVSNALEVIKTTMTARCRDFITSAICFHSFPPCIAEGNRPRPRQICQSDCYNFQSVCRNDAILAKRHPSIAPVFPECTELAEPGMPAADNCVKLSASSSSPRQSGERSGASTVARPPSAPQTLAVNPISRVPFRVRVSWRPPQRPNGDLLSYNLRWTSEEESHEQDVAPQQTSVESGALSRGLMYAFEVRAENEHGLSEPIIARFNIPDGTPTGYPQNFTAHNLSPSSVKLSWQPPPKDQQNGRIRRYQGLFYMVSNPDIYQHFSTEARNHTLIGLRRNTLYAAQVQALTRVGRGPKTNRLMFRTP